MESERNWAIDKLASDPPRLHDTVGVWSEMNDLYGKYECVSLGWGSPDLQPPKFLREALEKVMEVPANNNYGRPSGHPELVKAVAEVYGAKMGRKIDPMAEIMIT